MFNWLRRLCGYHVCEEFTRWTTVTVDHVLDRDDVIFGRVPAGSVLHKTEGARCTYRSRWQERQCTLCGKIYIRRLP